MKQHHYEGLTKEEVLESRLRYGTNVFSEPEKVPLWIRFLQKFKDPLIIILLVAGVLSVSISFYEYFVLREDTTVFFEPVGIFIAILLATGLAFLFEVKADREFAILNQVNDEEPVVVIREGRRMQIPKCDVVVGDIVLINTGDEIPADGLLLEAVSMNVDESTLTGEPVCYKSVADQDFDPEATFPTNQVLRGTKVMEGHGIFRVQAVGDATENGKVYEAARIDDSVKTPLNEQLERLGTLIARVSYGIAFLVIVGRVMMYFHHYDFEWVHFVSYVLQTVMIAVTLIVVAVPEGLPMAVTLSLAYSMRRMLKTNNLVRKMHACETMGAATVICTDKTGTLTQNVMHVYETCFETEGEQYQYRVCQGIAVNTTASLQIDEGTSPKVLGNPTEGALLLWLYDQGIDYRALKEEVVYEMELPFSTERKLMAVVIKTDQERILYVKGAPEIVYGKCVLSDQKKKDIQKRLLTYQEQGMRTLGFAYQRLDDTEMPIVGQQLVANQMTFLGVVAISDPVRPDVPQAVRECMEAGIAVKIVTGDTAATAREIARQVGLWSDDDTDRQLITGPEFAALSDTELLERVMDLKVIARARPMDKKRLVETLQLLGQVVAVTGDGTNVAPALKAAHVGLSMGDGTSVAKEASDITIIDNSFSSIGRAVMWGRSLYRNIQRFILFQMTVNVVACLIVLVGAFMGTEVPLTVTQMLWVNLIMDTFAAMALASLPPSTSVMKEKPRDRRSFIINRDMARQIIGVGCTFFIVLICLLYHYERNGWSPYEQSLFFTIFVMLQFWNMFNARAYATGESALKISGCRGFLLIAHLVFFGQLLIVTLGGRMFNVTPLCWQDWLLIISATSVVLWIGEIGRLRVKRTANQRK
ncbi:MAG: calcium-translocating P-type ATPase, PMCA-type [Prevotella sp.]|nr:calcium-translocating P-type ATPase, PMCA-type [Prevotella sp.]